MTDEWLMRSVREGDLTRMGVLFERQTRTILEARARERATALTWDASYREHWLPLVEGLLRGGENVHVLPTPSTPELVAAG